jgi:hypothetical protein
MKIKKQEYNSHLHGREDIISRASKFTFLSFLTWSALQTAGIQVKAVKQNYIKKNYIHNKAYKITSLI